MNQELTTIRLYGQLGAKFGRVHHMAVSSAAEAVRALGAQLPGFDRFLTEAKDKGFGFSVFYGKSNLKDDELRQPSFGDDIRIAPILFGSKSSGWFTVIVGAVMVVAGAVLGAMGYGVVGGPMMKMGYAMIVGGVIQMLAPTPKGMSARDRPENTPSYTFNGPVNTQAQGSPNPVCYGEVLTGSAVISAGINAVDQAYVPSGNEGAGSGGGGGGGASDWNNNQEVQL